MSASACTRSMLILLITLIAMINVFLWPPYVIGQGIYFHPVVSSSSFFLLFFPRLISAVTHRMSTFHTWFGHSANLQCRSDMCCMWLAENTGHKTTTTTTVLRPFLRDHPGEPVPEENFRTLWCKARLTEADTLTIRLGASHSIRTNQCPPPPSPHIFTYRMPFLPPNQQCQSTEKR